MVQAVAFAGTVLALAFVIGSVVDGISSSSGGICRRYDPAKEHSHFFLLDRIHQRIRLLPDNQIRRFLLLQFETSAVRKQIHTIGGIIDVHAVEAASPLIIIVGSRGRIVSSDAVGSTKSLVLRFKIQGFVLPSLGAVL